MWRARAAAVAGTVLAALCAIVILLILRYGDTSGVPADASIPPLLWFFMGPLAWALAGAALLGALGTRSAGSPDGRRHAARLLALAGVGSLLPVLWLAVWLVGVWISGGAQHFIQPMKYAFGIFSLF